MTWIISYLTTGYKGEMLIKLRRSSFKDILKNISWGFNLYSNLCLQWMIGLVDGNGGCCIQSTQNIHHQTALIHQLFVDAGAKYCDWTVKFMCHVTWIRLSLFAIVLNIPLGHSWRLSHHQCVIWHVITIPGNNLITKGLIFAWSGSRPIVDIYINSTVVLNLLFHQ